MERGSGDLKNLSQCTEPSIGLNLALYESGRLEEEETRVFERHVSHCPFCAQELYEMSEVTQILREEARDLFQEEGDQVAALPEASRTGPEATRLLAKWREYLTGPAWKVAAGFLILVLGYVVYALLWNATSTLSPEALLPLPEEPPAIDFSIEPEPPSHVQAAIDLYQRKEYEEALRRLPGPSGNGEVGWRRDFFVGMIRLYQGDAQGAETQLSRALPSAGKSELEVRWYLAVALSRLGKWDQVAEQLQAIVGEDDELYKAQAEEALRKISRQVGSER